MAPNERSSGDRVGLTEAEKAVHWFGRARHYRAEVERLRNVLDEIAFFGGTELDGNDCRARARTALDV